ncbi:hypothetical protein C5167_026399 [Papaver somniferum]|nr:hypothetical protein C5167_026399 [Papaver somniferum]
MFNTAIQSWSLGITRRIQDHVINDVAGLLHVLDDNNIVFTNLEDKRVWIDGDAVGEFSVKKCYRWLVQRNEAYAKAEHINPKKIWNK